jgi:hypothetical protein
LVQSLGFRCQVSEVQGSKVENMDFVVVLDKILIPEDEHENEYEKSQLL